MTTIDQAFIRAYGPDSSALPADPTADSDLESDRLHGSYRVDRAESSVGPPHESLETRQGPPPETSLSPSMAPEGYDGQRSDRSDQGSEREVSQPLSSFVSERQVLDTFEPALGVDRFIWPPVCDSLQSQSGGPIVKTALRLRMAARSGKKALAVAGCRSGDGCTTTLLCLARQLAADKDRVVVVDADFRRPALAERLGLAVPVGWDDVLRGERTLDEVVVLSAEEGLAVLPLRDPSGNAAELATSIAATTNLKVLRQHYDMVLIDLGPILDDVAHATAIALVERGGIDATLVVHHGQREVQDELGRATQELSRSGAPAVGIVETFAA